MGRLRITLVKSPLGAKPRHRKTVRSLGLRKMHHSVEKDDIPAVRGMVDTVNHLVHVEEIK